MDRQPNPANSLFRPCADLRAVIVRLDDHGGGKGAGVRSHTIEQIAIVGIAHILNKNGLGDLVLRHVKEQHLDRLILMHANMAVRVYDDHDGFTMNLFPDSARPSCLLSL
jgi:hypothetical protein